MTDVQAALEGPLADELEPEDVHASDGNVSVKFITIKEQIICPECLAFGKYIV